MICACEVHSPRETVACKTTSRVFLSETDTILTTSQAKADMKCSAAVKSVAFGSKLTRDATLGALGEARNADPARYLKERDRSTTRK